MNRLRSFLAVALALTLSGCSPKRVDPPTWFHESERASGLAALLHARDAGGRHYRVLDTHSMEPLLVGGDYIATAPAAYGSLQLGQVVVYRADWLPAGSPPVTHRLVQKDGYGWILSGDNNARSEPQWRVTERNYVGLVVGIYRTAK